MGRERSIRKERGREEGRAKEVERVTRGVQMDSLKGLRYDPSTWHTHKISKVGCKINRKTSVGKIRGTLKILNEIIICK